MLDWVHPMALNLDRGPLTVANMNKDRKACRVAVVLLFVVVLVCFNFDLTVHLQRKTFNETNEDREEFGANVGLHKVRELLEKLRETARLAADGHDYSTLTAAEREAWHMQNPCESRSELPAMYASRKHIRDISPNPMWDQVLNEYSNLHRICITRVGNVTDHFLKKSNATVPGCKFLLTEGEYGLGNRFMVTVSAVLYAIVSQRILLVPSWMTFGSILCEPFVGSSWYLDDQNFPMPGAGPANNSWVGFSIFSQNLNVTLNLLNEKQEERSNTKTGQSGTKLPPLVDAIVLAAIWEPMPWKPQKSFYCSTEQTFLSEVPWVYLSGCIYTVPELFGSPAFGSTLQALFPDRMVMTRLLRSTFLPSDSVWSRFKHLNHVYFQHADRRVGIQLRIFDTRDTPTKVMNDRIMDCVLNNGILPRLNYSSTAESVMSPPPSAPITTVYIASLYSDLHDAMSEFYLGNPTITGEAVGVVQVTSRQQESSGTEEDRQAFVEMLLLSMSDRLLITPASTFGGMGQAYGGLTPWFIRATIDDGPSCERGQTTDPCEQNAYLGYRCPNDPPNPPDWNGLLGPCLKIDLGNRFAWGIQILDNRLSLDAEEFEPIAI